MLVEFRENLRNLYRQRLRAGVLLSMAFIALVLATIAPLRVTAQALETCAVISDNGNGNGSGGDNENDSGAAKSCCASSDDRATPAPCCCAAPAVPGNMQTATPQPPGTKFIPIKSGAPLTAPTGMVIASRAISTDTLGKPAPRTTKLPLYLRLRSLLI